MTPESPTSTEPDASETRESLRRLKQLVELLLREFPSDDEAGPQLLDVLEAHLGVRPDGLAVVTEDVQPHRLVDADIAMTEIAGLDPEHRLIGLGGGDMRHHMTFADQLQGARLGHAGVGQVGQVDYLRSPTGPRTEDQRSVVSLGIWLFTYDQVPLAVRQQAAQPNRGRPTGSLEVLAPDQAVAERFVLEVRRLMDERSVFRGQVVTFSHNPYGQELSGVTFVERPSVRREDVILPDGLLDRVSQHVLGIAEHRAALTAHGQHLKRGILLYGPPGTGKTHTMRYLLSASPGTTAVLLSGQSFGAIHAATQVARAHQPAIVVLEDCDLVAEDRSMGHGPKPLLFEVLDALDGLDGDADVSFLLTTNRVADLERALTQRPGRVDLAAEIPLPDRAGRARLFRLYADGLFSDDALDAAAARSDGTTASFAKELVRRAVLRAAVAGEDPADEHLTGALDDLLSDVETLTRTLLGAAGADGAAGPSDAGFWRTS